MASADWLDSAAIGIAVVLTIVVAREMDAAYATFTVLMILMPFVFGRGAGLLRTYFLIVPFYVAMAKHLSPRLVHAAAVLALASLQITLASGIVH